MTLNLAPNGTVPGSLANGSTVSGTWSAATVGGAPTYKFEITQVHRNAEGKVVGYTHSKGTFTHDATTRRLEGSVAHEHKDGNKVKLRSENGTFKGERK
jgi:hypothetical protein